MTKNQKDIEETRKSRRKFFKYAGATAGAFVLAKSLSFNLDFPALDKSGASDSEALPWYANRLPMAKASFLVPQIPLAGTAIPKYVDQVPLFGPGGIAARVDASTHTALTIGASEFQEMILPASIYAPLLPPFNAGAYVWGYDIKDTNTNTALSIPLYPAFTIEARRNTPVSATYVNGLPVSGSVLQTYITVDQTLHWADPLNLSMDSALRRAPYTGPPPIVTHLHGGEVPSDSDGGPDAWFTPGNAQTGPAFNPGTYSYPNGQEATSMFYHDHALGATRLNLYAGLVGFYFIRDAFDTGLTNNPLNLPAGAYEFELAVQDKQFDTNGQLLFPDGYPAGFNGPPPNPTIHPFWNPEFFGDVMLVNGKSWPYMNVEPRRYRFHFVDGCNARFLEMSLGTKVPFWHIGTDGGLLDTPVMTPTLFLAPGERADVIVDFAPVAGKTIVMTNSAKAPYPAGTAADPKTTGQVMQFRVAPTVTSTDTTFNPALGGTLRGGAGQPPLIVRLANPTTGAANVTPDKKRSLTLVEIPTALGPVLVTVNNTKWDGTMSPNSLSNAAGMSELPQVGSTEVWEIINLTMDAHPIHLHLVQFQLLNRQAFQATKYRKLYDSLFPAVTFTNVFGTTAYPGGVFIPEYGPPLPYNTLTAQTGNKLGGNPDVTPFLQGKIMPPNPEEAGWKDTFKMFPGEVTRIIVRWAPQDSPLTGAGAPTPGVNQYPFDPTTGPGYVWHCHIVDHEDNEMMRPYSPVP